MAEGVTFVIFGGTGDLTKRKLAPAFARLLDDAVIAKDSLIVGVGRSDFTDASYRNALIKGKDAKTKESIKKLRVKYFQGDVSKGLSKLSSFLKKHEKRNSGRVFYLATSFTLFGKITKGLQSQGLTKEKGCFNRVVFEKPFGQDSKTNASFETEIHSVFKEDQIYRIDHYLGKETISNLTTLKFENPIFEAVLNNRYVDSISVIVDEDLKMGKRIHYYNEFGAVKDMIQSHLLQVLSLILMQRPQKFTAAEIHKQKEKALQQLQVRPAKENLLGQYRGYQKELDNFGLENIHTETFVKMSLESKNSLWKGVSLFLRTGKALPKKYGQIIVIFKHETNMGCLPNKLEINIQPTQDVNLYLNTGNSNVCEQIKLNFCHACQFGPNSAEGYEKMLGEIIRGDHTMFTSAKENKYSWKIIDDFLEIKEDIPFEIYPDGSDPEILESNAD